VAFFEAVKSGGLDTSMELFDRATIDFGIQERLKQWMANHIAWEDITIIGSNNIIIGSIYTCAIQEQLELWHWRNRCRRQKKKKE